MAKVFLSFAGADLARARDVYGWLTADGHEVFFDRSDRDGIPAGVVWKRELYEQISRVDAMVCLVTPAYQTSLWCTAEIAIADARGCKLVPLRGEPGIVHRLINEQQHTNDDLRIGRQEALSMLRRLDSGGRRPWRSGNPYPGLRPFSAEMSALFFGRSAEVRELSARLRTTTPARVVALQGPSGCGKSSMLAAGLIPHLNAEWLVVGPWSPENSPLRSLAVELARAARRLDLDWPVDTVRARLEEPHGLRTAAEDLLIAQPHDGPARHVLVALDQAEDLFASEIDPTERDQLATLIQTAFKGPVRLVLTVRAEYDAELDFLAPLPVESFRLGALDRSRLRGIVEEPARVAGLRVAPELSARLVEDTGSGEALPLLAVTLHDLADGKQAGDTIGLDEYDRLGGMQEILARRGDEALAAACTKSGLPEDVLLAGLVRMVSEDDSGRRGRRLVDPADLTPPMQTAVAKLIESRLVVSEGEHGHVRLVHDALVTEWPRLADAVDQHSRALRAAVLVERAAADWIQAGEADGYLWDGVRVGAIEADLGGSVPAAWKIGVAEPGRRFLDASRVRAGREVRRWRVVAAALLALVITAGVLTVVTVQNNREISANLRKANAQLLADQATAHAPLDTVRATQLALAAYRADPTNPDVRSALARQYLTQISVDKVFSNLAPATIKQLKSSADGSVLLLTHGAGATVVTGVHGSRPATVQLATADTAHHYLSPDGRWVVTTGESGVLRWDLRHPGRPTELTAGRPDAEPLGTFSADSTRFAFRTADKRLAILEIATGKTVSHRLESLDAPDLTEIWLSPDENVVLLVHHAPATAVARPSVRATSLSGEREWSVSGRVAVLSNGSHVVECGKTGKVLDGASGARVRAITCGSSASDIASNALNITADDRHFVTSIGEPFGADEPTLAKLTFTDVSDGTKFSMNVPPLRHPEDDPRGNFQRPALFAVGSSEAGEPALLISQGRSLLRVRADPRYPPVQDRFLKLLPGGERLLRTDLEGTTSIVDTATGRTLGSVPVGRSDTDTVFPAHTVDRRTVAVALLPEDQATVTIGHYAVPTLRGLGEVTINPPDGIPLTTFDFDVQGDRVLAVVGGRVSVWNLTSGRQEKNWAKIPVANTGTWDPDGWYPLARPGHADEVALLRPNGGAILWSLSKNAPLPRRIDARLPDIGAVFLGGHAAFDPDGGTFLAHEKGGVIRAWEVDSGRLVADEIAVAEGSEVLGFTADGHFVTSDLDTLTFWSLEGQRMNTMALRTPGLAGDPTGLVKLADSDHFMLEMFATPPIVLRSTPQAWFETLCRIQDRPFTAVERAKLPPGGDTTPPCSRE